jgi:hypothetical protein
LDATLRVKPLHLDTGCMQKYAALRALISEPYSGDLMLEGPITDRRSSGLQQPSHL